MIMFSTAVYLYAGDRGLPRTGDRQGLSWYTARTVRRSAVSGGPGRPNALRQSWSVSYGENPWVITGPQMAAFDSVSRIGRVGPTSSYVLVVRPPGHPDVLDRSRHINASAPSTVVHSRHERTPPDDD